MIEPIVDASRLKGGSTGFIKKLASAEKSYRKDKISEFKKQQKEEKKAKDKRSASAKKGAATRAANKKAATTTTTTTTKSWNPLPKKPATAPKGLPGTVPGQAGGAKGRPASQSPKIPVAGKPPRAPKQTATKSKRTPPAKGTKPVGKVAPVTKATPRGRLR